MAQTATERFLIRFSRSASVVVMVIGAMVLLGWLLNVSLLKSVVQQLASMDPLAAVLFILAGLGLRQVAFGPATAESRRQGRWYAAVVAIGGAVKLAEHFVPMELSVGQWLVREQPEGGGAAMTAPNTAFNFLLCGVGLLMFDFESRRGMRPAQCCFLASGFVAMIALVGYAYRVLPLYSIGSAQPMALNTAIAFELLSLSALAARPDRGIMVAIVSSTTGGAMARRLLPAAVLIPFCIGGLRLLGEKHGLYGTDFGVSLFAVANMLVFTLLIWWNARLLHGADRERLRVERRVAIQYAATRVLAESPGVPDATGKILEAICRTLDWRVGAMWNVDTKSGRVRCTSTWHSPEKLVTDFAQSCRNRALSRGEGLPGRVWDGAKAVWIEDIRSDSNFSRTDAALDAGLKSGFGFPVRFDGETCGVLEFFSDRIESPEAALLEALNGIGSQLGQFIERKQAEERLRHASAELARSNTDLQQFAYVASHDLTEPLRMVRSYLELLNDRHKAGLDAEAQEFIGYALDGAARMQTLISDLLAYARVDSRGRDFVPTRADEVLDAALSNLKVAIAETGARIEREPLPTVIADEVQLAQVFQNLVGNAIKFRGPDPPHIRIGAHRSNGEWIFQVQDNGVGIDPAQFDRIFVLFQRLHTRQQYPGTGIGLAICKRIIERHRGRIWVESRPGHGSTFFFSIPADGSSSG